MPINLVRSGPPRPGQPRADGDVLDVPAPTRHLDVQSLVVPAEPLPGVLAEWVTLDRLLSSIELRGSRRPGTVASVSVVERRSQVRRQGARRDGTGVDRRRAEPVDDRPTPPPGSAPLPPRAALVGPIPDLLFAVLQPAGPVTRVLAAVDGERVVVYLPRVPMAAGRRWLAGVVEAIADRVLTIGGAEIRLTPVVGLAEPARGLTAEQIVSHATDGWVTARSRLDLQPVLGHAAVADPAGRSPLRRAVLQVRTAVARTVEAVTGTAGQIVGGFAVALVGPYLLYTAAAARGWYVTGPAYAVVVTGLVLTAVLIWHESLHALGAPRTPAATAAPEPATAVIAAYLPNEATTIVETVEQFQRIDYPAGLQIIVAYNRSTRLPVEHTLERLAAADRRIVLLRVDGSTSKAQNVNAAIPRATGAFIGIFDADHHPATDSFTRAWRWLSNGYDVVQGHCVIRNGAASIWSRLVAVEFETIYAVSHPGRTVVQGFGIFGGSNGFWRTELLHRTRFRSTMLTEDIDSSIRVLTAGARVANDGELVSRELAPETLRGLWHQRVRWSQGWFEVARRRLVPALRSPRVRTRQKAGLLALLAVPQVYPWLTLQIIPLVVFGLLHPHQGVVGHWIAPVFILATLVTASSGVVQVVLAKKLGEPHTTAHTRWFWLYLAASALFYAEFKNTVARTAQLRYLLRRNNWVVTARSSSPAPPADPVPGPQPAQVAQPMLESAP